MRATKEWLYATLYPGSLARLDLVLKLAVRPLVAQFDGQFDRWFFIRYLDESGPHIRLRFHGSPRDLNAIRQALDDWGRAPLAALASMPAPELRRLLPGLGGAAAWGSVALQYEKYQPEYDKYGGPQGVAIAEELFEGSSRLVLGYLDTGPASMAERAALAVLLMSMVGENGVRKQRSRRQFWQRYLEFWSNGQPRGNLFLESLLESARRRCAVLQRETSVLRQHPVVLQLLDGYTRSVRKAFRKVAMARLNVSPAALCFHYIHMMNNRLGIYPLEEAYLACFLLIGQPTGETPKLA